LLAAAAEEEDYDLRPYYDMDENAALRDARAAFPFVNSPESGACSSAERGDGGDFGEDAFFELDL